MTIPQAIERLLARQDLDHAAMTTVMQHIMSGQATEIQIAGFLVALRAKGETVDEIAAAAEVLRSLATRVPVQAESVIDTCGTGGDGANTFNISTTSAFVLAAAGCKVAKHGNRAVSSVSGSADVLEAAGININLSPEQVAACVDQVGIGFLFAPNYHGAMKYTSPVRKQLGVRTLFNLLGPLVNPAGAKHQLLGVFNQQWLEPIAQVLGKLGSKHVLVVNAEDGLDEISLAATTHVAELNNGQVCRYQINPEDFGMTKTALSALVISNPQESLAMMLAVLQNQPGPARDIVVLNAGAAIYAADRCASLNEGVQMASSTLAKGLAFEKLQSLINYSNTF